MKKILAVVLALAFALSVPFVSMAAPAVNVTVFDKPVVWTDAEPFIDANNRTLVPLRAVGEALDLEVGWDEESRTALFTRETIIDEFGTKETITLAFDIGEPEVGVYFRHTYADGTFDAWGDIVPIDTAAVIVNNRTYAPIRYLAEFFGYGVRWDPDTRTVIIDEQTYS